MEVSHVAVDGLDALRQEIGVREIAALIERTARWVAPETFRLLPVWFPEHGRGHPFYKGNWSTPQTNTKRSTGVSSHKVEGNIYASQALTLALGLRKADRPNWSCCHIWGVDDPAFQKSNDVVKDRRFYSCVANMVLLPTPLKAFTDAMPEIKAMLRICSRNLYGWTCDHAGVAATVATLDAWDAWDDYPASWPRSPVAGPPLGMVALTSDIERTAAARRAAIARDLSSAGPHYPRADVRAVLNYWRIEI
ncbi:hypothetical protein U8607_18480 [Methylobacterium durans]|uniref:hypothetical protein n=1 Tax=Methylobacterium durans TaxID=2202825 RepID=UPI002AFEFEA7|nr:hypothetical protein [Methylobacterium durans]MEA1834080.1 hypothetical protein [Methylobacterium durans]